MKKMRKLGLIEIVGDMTSMIDIVFLLLIFFILMPFKTTESKLEAFLPKDSSTASTPAKQVEKIDIRIKVVGETEKINIRNMSGVVVKFNGKRQTSFLGLLNRLSEVSVSLEGDLSKIPVEINADEDVPFFFVLKAVDYAKFNKFSFIKFPVSPKVRYGQKVHKEY